MHTPANDKATRSHEPTNLPCPSCMPSPQLDDQEEDPPLMTHVTTLPHGERRCPDCGKPGRALDVPSDAVEYFRCCACGFVWTHDRDDPSAPPTAITMPPRVLRIREQ